MALQGKLILNGADYVPFELYGVGVFMAHSGRGVYRNNGACGAILNDGPLPSGKYSGSMHALSYGSRMGGGGLWRL